MSEGEPIMQTGARVDQVERYKFEVHFPGEPFPNLVVDEPLPVGRNAGPSPVRVLAAAVGHCMSSTLYNTLERARIPSTPVRTTVRVEIGPNANSRRRVRKMALEIQAAPRDETDRERFEHCVSIFEDYCTVSGAVREGIVLVTRVIPPTGSA